MTVSPKVTFIIVARDAERHLPAALACLAAQDYPSERLQCLFVDGLSADGTRRLAAEFKAAHPALDFSILDNPGRLLASGWNAALARAQGDVVLRVDAHSEFPPDFVRRHIEARSGGRAITGGPTTTNWEDGGGLIALAENSPFGGGAAAFRRRTEPGFVDTLAHAAYDRAVFAEVGGYDERLARTEDNEIHHRMKRAGHRFWFDPAIRSTRRARATVSGLLRQKYGNGLWIGLTLGVAPGAFGVRHFVPGAFTLALLGALALGPALSWLPLAGLLAAYAAAAAGFAFAAAGPARAPALAGLFFLMHCAYGFGTLAGLAAMPWFKWKTRRYSVPRPVAR
ncbi:MAG: glycosyltransferase family 2 protein [Elusimicrobiota bacterium]|nr:MAG: glycosyltransferase family 2 protein [Elusimicrobiota bacterium]